MRTWKRREDEQRVGKTQKRERQREMVVERVSANKCFTTDRSYGAQVQARTGHEQGGHCCMNSVIRVLRLPCTIGKKEGISFGIAWQKGVLDLVGDSK